MKSKPRVIGHCVLTDQGEGSRRINVTIEECHGTLCIRPQGYGDYASKPGHGTPLILELMNNTLQMVCCADIHREYATAIVNMELANENTKICSICGNLCAGITAHLHQGRYIGDECCWDERLKASE